MQGKTVSLFDGLPGLIIKSYNCHEISVNILIINKNINFLVLIIKTFIKRLKIATIV